MTEKQPTRKAYCEMCGHRRGLRIAPDPDGKLLTLCRLCRKGAAQLRQTRDAALALYEALKIAAAKLASLDAQWWRHSPEGKQIRAAVAKAEGSKSRF